MVDINTLYVGNPDVGPGLAPIHAFTIPVLDGLTLCHFTKDASTYLTNFAPGGSAATISVGAEDMDFFMRTDDGASIRTQVAETEAMTLMAIFRGVGTAAQTGVIGTYAGGSNPGVSLYSIGGTILTGSAEKTTGAYSANVSFNKDIWTLASCVVPATGSHTTHNHTSGASGTNANTDPRQVTGSDKIFIAGLPNVSFRASVDIMLGMAWNKALDTDELAAMVAWARSYALLIGDVTV